MELLTLQLLAAFTPRRLRGLGTETNHSIYTPLFRQISIEMSFGESFPNFAIARNLIDTTEPQSPPRLPS